MTGLARALREAAEASPRYIPDPKCATCRRRPRAPGSVDCTECARLADESAAGAQTRQGD